MHRTIEMSIDIFSDVKCTLCGIIQKRALCWDVYNNNDDDNIRYHCINQSECSQRIHKNTSHITIPPIEELTLIPDRFDDGLSWYIHFTTLRLFGFSHISNSWFPAYDSDFEKKVIENWLQRLNNELNPNNIEYSAKLLHN